MADKTRVLTSDISVFDLDETVHELRRLCDEGGKHYVCVSNVHTVVMGLQDPAYARVTNEATLATADGVPLVWASRILGQEPVRGRASGPDILERLLNDPASRHLRHFFYGSTSEVLRALESRLPALAPHAQLAGFYSPAFRQAKLPGAPLDAAEQEDCRLINEARPHVVWVGLGAPKQEIWMHRARASLEAPVLIGVGAAFDFLAGNKSRAPLWMQKAGLEWFHRMMSEPGRLASRYLKTNPVFVAEVIKQALLREKR